jgi:cytochrome c biogenesis protein CcmG/thiol:disulfide interchange protein DsbE
VSRPRPRRSLWWLLAIALTGVALAVLAFAPLRGGPPSPTSGDLVGDPAPPLRGETLGGTAIDLVVDGQDRLTWVNFWATSCEPCRSEMPAMQALAEQHADDLLIVGVNWGEAPDSVADFVDRYGVRYPIMLDPTLDTYYAWNATDGLPRHFFVDGDGIVVREVIGPLDPSAMVAVLDELL